MLLLVSMVLTLGRVLFSLWVTVILWAWFAVPFGLPALTMAQTFGIGLILSAFRPDRMSDKKVRKFLTPESNGQKEERQAVDIVRSLLLTAYFALLLGAGWLVKP